LAPRRALPAIRKSQGEKSILALGARQIFNSGASVHPTLRENPAEAEVASHQLLLRAGYIRQLSAGIYSYLFLAQRSLLKISTSCARKWTPSARRNAAAGAESGRVWQESGRWDVMGDNLFR
jgi:prolyl-tRNA synthetase